MLRGIDRVEAQPQPQPPARQAHPGQRERLRNAVKVAYGADRLIASVRSQLVALLPSGDTEVMAEVARQPLGKRVSRRSKLPGRRRKGHNGRCEIAPKVLADMTPSARSTSERLINLERRRERVHRHHPCAGDRDRARHAAKRRERPGPDAPLKEAGHRTRYPQAAWPGAIAPELRFANSAVVYAPLFGRLNCTNMRDALERASLIRRVLEATDMALEEATPGGSRSSSGERSWNRSARRRWPSRQSRTLAAVKSGSVAGPTRRSGVLQPVIHAHFFAVGDWKRPRKTPFCVCY